MIGLKDIMWYSMCKLGIFYKKKFTPDWYLVAWATPKKIFVLDTKKYFNIFSRNTMIGKMLPIDSQTTNCLFASKCFLYPAPFFNFIKSVEMDVYITRKRSPLKREKDCTRLFSYCIFFKYIVFNWPESLICWIWRWVFSCFNCKIIIISTINYYCTIIYRAKQHSCCFYCYFVQRYRLGEWSCCKIRPYSVQCGRSL